LLGVFASCFDSRQVDYGGDDDGQDAAGHDARTMAAAFTVSVGRTGVLFAVEVAEAAVDKLLVMRSGHLGTEQYHNMMTASSTTLMPVDMQKDLQKKAQDLWMTENPDAMRKLNELGLNKTRHARTARMLYRRACFKEFGGQEWMFFIIAVGGINRRLIECAKLASTELVEAKKRKLGDKWNAPEAWQPGTAQRRQLAHDRAASASSAGPLYHAVEHNLSKAKELRARGRALDKLIVKERAAYEAHTSKMSARAWDRLLSEAERVWEDALEASDAAGVEYTDREGNICCKRSEMDTWVGRTLTYYQRAVRDNI
jgi:hypothetical protein